MLKPRPVAAAKNKKRRTTSAKNAPSPAPTRPKPPPSESRIYIGLAALVVVLGGLVWWSLPGNHAPDAPTAEADAEADPEEVDAAPPAPKTRVPRPTRAGGELAVLTERSLDDVKSLALASDILRKLEAKHCAPACDAVRKLIEDGDGLDLEVRATEELILPPKDTFDTVGATLTPGQRDSIEKKTASVVVHVTGPFAKEQVPARALFAVTLLLAQELDGFVYDEVERRIEDHHDFARRMVTAKLGEAALGRQHVVIQLYREDEGTARLRTLGMERFGSPDLSIRGASMGIAPKLAEVMNAIAQQIAHGADDAPLTVTLADVAKAAGKKPSDLGSDPGSAKPLTLDIVEAPDVEGDPDDMLELVPRGGSNREAWDAAYTTIFGPPSSIEVAEDDKELAAIATKARRDLPTAIKRFQAGEGELFVKGPFAIPEDQRVDGGSATELLWVAVVSCTATACTGTLSNEPTYATNLAAGKTTSVKLSEATDWMLQLKDGGAAGGESIKALKARAAAP